MRPRLGHLEPRAERTKKAPPGGISGPSHLGLGAESLPNREIIWMASRLEGARALSRG